MDFGVPAGSAWFKLKVSVSSETCTSLIHILSAEARASGQLSWEKTCSPFVLNLLCVRIGPFGPLHNRTGCSTHAEVAKDTFYMLNYFHKSSD